MRLFSLIDIIEGKRKERKKRRERLVPANFLTSDSTLNACHGHEFIEQESGQRGRCNASAELLRIYWMFWKTSAQLRNSI